MAEDQTPAVQPAPAPVAPPPAAPQPPREWVPRELAEDWRPTLLLFGNTNPHDQYPVFDPETGEPVGTRGAPAKHLKQSETRVELEPDFADEVRVAHALSTDNDLVLSLIGKSLPDADKRYAIGLQHLTQIIDTHAGGAKPAWVVCDDAEFARVVGAHFGCPVGRPTALLTNVGRDAVHQQHMSTSAQPASFNYMALTASTGAPAAGDTTLTGEITTGGGGLVRAQASFAHTVGTNTSTLTKTFTANGSDTLPVTIAQIGILNAASVGTLAYHTALSSTATLNVTGDNITVTETVTAG